MVIFEEEGIKKSFKIILNSKGVIIKTKGFISTNYKEVYSKLYHEVNSIRINSKFIIAEFIIDGVELNFDSEEDATKIKDLITLGKTNLDRLIYYIGSDSREVDLDDIDEEKLDDDVMINRFNRSHSPESANSSKASQVGVSEKATNSHKENMDVKKSVDASQQNISGEIQHQTPPPYHVSQTPPPPIGIACFSFYAFIEGKQQGPYNEKQFKALVDYGLVNATTPVWKAGMAQWAAASAVPETSMYFQTGNNLMTPPHLS